MMRILNRIRIGGYAWLKINAQGAQWEITTNLVLLLSASTRAE